MNIFESVIDQTLKNYSKFVFDDYKTNKPKLKGRVRQKIIDDVKKIDNKIGVVEFFIKGSILTKNYSKNADIDIFVRVNTNLYTDDQLRTLLRPVFEEIDDTYLDGCPYPFQYYITNKKYNIENTEAAYGVLNDEWIKKSSSKNIDINEYMDDFKKYVEQFSDFSEELRRNMIDYDILLDIPSDQIKGLKQKLDIELIEINKNIDDLSEVYKEVRDMRNDAFSNKMTPSEIKKYGIKTRLPGNVVFKLLERYYYLDLYKRIRKIIGDDGKISHSEYDELNKLLKTKLTNEKTSFKNVFGNVKGRRDMQHKPRHRQQQANAGMLGHGDRKSVNLMPDYQRSKGIKGDHTIDGAKDTSRVIRVKQGTPEAIRLAKKYRIDNPVGKKTVAGNQYDQGVTIIFEETLEQKVKRANRQLILKEYFLDNARALLMKPNGKLVNVEYNHFDTLEGEYCIDDMIRKKFKKEFGQEFNIDNDDDHDIYSEYVHDYIAEKNIFFVVLDTKNKEIHVRPNFNKRPTRKQIKELKDWAIENDYNTKIIFDHAVA